MRAWLYYRLSRDEDGTLPQITANISFCYLDIYKVVRDFLTNDFVLYIQFSFYQFGKPEVVLIFSFQNSINIKIIVELLVFFAGK